MALLSFAGSPHGGKLTLLPEWDKQPRITPRTIIDHSIVGSALGAYYYFRDHSGLESHFIIDLDGEIWQLMDTDREADANLDANAYAISIETADNGDPNTYKWTSQQLESLKWLHERLLQIHSTIPRRESVSCGNPSGLGYHTMHGAPSCWTPVAKRCPGTVRKQQFDDSLLPAFLSPMEDDMPYSDWPQADKDALLKDIRDKVVSPVYRLLARGEGGGDIHFQDSNRGVKERLEAKGDELYRLAARGEHADGSVNLDGVHYQDSHRYLRERLEEFAAAGLTFDDVKQALREVFAEAQEPPL